MIIRNLDSEGDWTFGNGKNDYLKDDEAIKLNILTRLKEWQNDCFFSLKSGIDYENRLDFNQQVLLEIEVKNVISQSFGVVEITFFELIFNSETRKVIFNVIFKSIFSPSVQIQSTI